MKNSASQVRLSNALASTVQKVLNGNDISTADAQAVWNEAGATSQGATRKQLLSELTQASPENLHKLNSAMVKFYKDEILPDFAANTPALQGINFREHPLMSALLRQEAEMHGFASAINDKGDGYKFTKMPEPVLEHYNQFTDFMAEKHGPETAAKYQADAIQFTFHNVAAANAEAERGDAANVSLSRLAQFKNNGKAEVVDHIAPKAQTASSKEQTEPSTAQPERSETILDKIKAMIEETIKIFTNIVTSFTTNLEQFFNEFVTNAEQFFNKFVTSIEQFFNKDKAEIQQNRPAIEHNMSQEVAKEPEGVSKGQEAKTQAVSQDVERSTNPALEVQNPDLSKEATRLMSGVMTGVADDSQKSATPQVSAPDKDTGMAR